MSTEQYGRLWLAFSNDTKQNLKLLSESPDPLRATLHLLRDKLQLHIVDIIGGEGGAVGFLASLNRPENIF